jgi:hypothetical protein
MQISTFIKLLLVYPNRKKKKMTMLALITAIMTRKEKIDSSFFFREYEGAIPTVRSEKLCHKGGIAL